MNNVLIFEENESFRNKIRSAMESFDINLNIFESCSQKDALSTIDEVSIDIFIVDLETHKKCNVECIEKYLIPHNTIVIADYLNKDDTKKLIDMEVFDVIYKPIDLNAFRVKLNTLLRIVERRKAYDMDSAMFNSEIMKYIKILDEDVLNG